METITILIIVIIITIILFSSFNISYSNETPISNNKIIPSNTLTPSTINKQTNKKLRSTKDNIGKYNPKASSYALYNLPEKDPYMTPDLKNQIDALRTQYYYDNCAKIPSTMD
jgi:hypothetical protein